MHVAGGSELSDARSLAVRAAERGWLDAAAVFDAGVRAAQLGAGATGSDALGGVLSPEQLGTLGAAEFAGTVMDPRSTSEPRATIRLRAPDSEAEERRRELDAAAEVAAPAARYVPGAMLGEGGMGRVVAALDRDTGRTIALKTLRTSAGAEPAYVQRFLAEARITAQLEHPAIIPVYDMGTREGELYYTMRIVRQRSLREVLALPKPREQWPLARLCTVLVQVCRALAYAHARGVLHRDIKPENILLGEYGEVYLADWGIAKVLGEAEITTGGSELSPTSAGTMAGAVLGTAGYMPPEQCVGELALDGRADVFAIGVVLYEVLTGKRPFDGTTYPAVLLATMTREPTAPRKHEPGCPLVLEDLCLRMLAKDREARPASVEEVAKEVEGYLEGAKEKARRHEEAERLAEEAETHARRHLGMSGEIEALKARARAALRDVKGWEGVENKREGWELEDRALEGQKEYARALAAAVERYAAALGHEAENPRVRTGLAGLYWASAERCEQERDAAGQMYYETLVRDYDDGTYAAKITAGGALTLETNPTGAEVVAYRYVERDRVFRAEEPRVLGRTPLREARLAAGTWLLVLKREGIATCATPCSREEGSTSVRGSICTRRRRSGRECCTSRAGDAS